MRRPFTLWAFKRPHEILEKSLGALERDVMAVAWTERDASVRDVCARLQPAIAYTTVMTTMDRLFKKGLLTRKKVGRAFVYNPTVTRHELEGAVANELV